MHVLVTGGNAGTGYFTAEQLAAAGVDVVIGSRDPAKAAAALASIRGRVPGARVRHVRLDLADLASLQPAVDSLDRLDAVVCNAGVLLDEPPRRETKDGHELVFGTSHLGPLRPGRPVAADAGVRTGRHHRQLRGQVVHNGLR